MSPTMKAAVLHALGTPLAIEQVPVPTPGEGDVLIRVVACGVCHSDLHAVDGDWERPPMLPLIPGHEVVGRIAALGPGVAERRTDVGDHESATAGDASHAQGFAIGDHVGVPWMYSSCGRCDSCLAGMETVCSASEATGYTKPGGYAEHLVAPAEFVGRIPEGADSYELAPILCAGVTTYRALKRTGAGPGQWVTIVGVGGLGHLAVQYAMAMGFRVAAVDVSDDKLALAKVHGAEVAVNAMESDPVAGIQKELGGSHAAVVTAVAPRAFEQAVSMLRPGGTVVYVGLPGADQDRVGASISAITNRELSIRGSSIGTRRDLEEAISFAASGKVRASTRTVRLEDVNAVLEEMRRGTLVGRVVLDLRSL
ncbi:MAG: zinc-dependent alcohol dehydrogenase [Candidatus Eisenbacteria bacterium]